MPDLLIELFSEEIPARMQARASADFKRLMTDGLVEAGLTYASAQAFATPRRLALTVEGVSDASPTTREMRKGPRVDAPDKAIEGFLRATGLAREALTVKDDKKGQVYMAEIMTEGQPAAAIVAEVLETTVRTFPWPKSMRWGDGGLRWVRPLHSILCLLCHETGTEVVPLTIEGISAGDNTRGHRVHAPDPFLVTDFDTYVAALKQAHVILDPAERSAAIWHEVTNQAFARGLEAVEDPGLLAEVSGLVEWPVVLVDAIREDFLALPPDVLRTSMKEHQKFFSLRNPKSGQVEGFATVANVEAPDGGATILAGNRKVLAARLSDAKFFWENDLRTVKTDGLEAMAAPLAQVTFHNRLGTVQDRIDRTAGVAHAIAAEVGADAGVAVHAARVVKADLASEMVYEFPELQGVMGRYYAESAGLAPEIARACELHYKPLGPSDDVPTEPVSVAVALADKLDLLAAFWAIDEKPTGSKDPFALRRAALGVIRILLTGGQRLRLAEICVDAIGAVRRALDQTEARAPSEQTSTSQADDLLRFFHDRLKVHLKGEGIAHDVIDAVLAMPGSDDLTLVVRRAEALNAFLNTEDGENLLQGFRRANNILTQAEAQDGVAYEYGPDRKFAEVDEEKALFDALDAAEAAIGSAVQAENYGAAMTAMAALRAPIDDFFEAVQVNTDNQVVRRNRLNLLHRIRSTCGAVADLTRLDSRPT